MVRSTGRVARIAVIGVISVACSTSAVSTPSQTVVVPPVVSTPVPSVTAVKSMPAVFPTASATTPIDASSPLPSAPASYVPPLAQPVTVGPMGGSGWIAVSVTGTFTVWSPDGSYDLVTSYGNHDHGSTALVTPAGDVVGEYPAADYALWLDSQHFMLITYGAGVGDRPNIAQVGTVGDPDVVSVDVPKGLALSNLHGAVAFATTSFDYAPDCGFGCPAYHFKVWSDNNVSSEAEGDPVAWSQDGTQLYVLHDVRNHRSGTGAPAAQDFVGWLEILALPDLHSVRTFPDTKVTDRSVAADPSGAALLYETVSDVGGSEYAHMLDMAGDTEKMLDVNQRWFGWASPGQLVIGPQMADPVTHYDGNGQPTYMAPVHGDATLYGIDGSVQGMWPDVGQDVATTWDGSGVAMYDDTFIGAHQLVTVFAGGQRVTPEALPVDHYLATCSAQLAPRTTAVSAACSLIVPGSDKTYYLIAIHQLQI